MIKDRILHLRVTADTVARIDQVAALFGAARLSQSAVVSMAVELLHAKLTGAPPPASQAVIERLGVGRQSKPSLADDDK